MLFEKKIEVLTKEQVKEELEKLNNKQALIGPLVIATSGLAALKLIMEYSEVVDSFVYAVIDGTKLYIQGRTMFLGVLPINNIDILLLVGALVILFGGNIYIIVKKMKGGNKK